MVPSLSGVVESLLYLAISIALLGLALRRPMYSRFLRPLFNYYNRNTFVKSLFNHFAFIILKPILHFFDKNATKFPENATSSQRHAQWGGGC